MWFKNLRIYRLNDSVKHTPEELNEALAQFEFTPCGNLEPVKYGWTQPLGRDGSEYVHAANGYIMICMKRQEKVLPGAIVKETLDEKVAEIAEREARSVGRAEKQSLKEEIIFSLMPAALVKSSYDFAYIDTKNQLLVVDTSSANRAEELLSALREAIGTLKTVPLTPVNTPRAVLTDWLTGGEIPADIEVGEECELTSLEDGRSVKFKHQDLWIDEVSRHIDSGLQVAKLVVNWKDSIECIIDDQFCFKRIRYGNEITEQADNHSGGSAADQFDIEFSVMALELSAFISAMSEAFGGVDDNA
ncbi:recombination-associated protein RdgC [Arenicella xantha]|uniref:Recombination-associated protein RdgC n=1 Tax=Arenicella xantha TaxID=644221 RepID=A0A395JNX5_9GAMM|nr:recombination-associated protein RdgC [Arenicella xantha]RBP51264.1 recombination associated protein RdgC [Arenicella xantha]